MMYTYAGFLLKAMYDHNKIAPCGIIKVFLIEFTGQTLLNWIEFTGQTQFNCIVYSKGYLICSTAWGKENVLSLAKNMYTLTVSNNHN